MAAGPTFSYVLYFSNPYRAFHLEVFSLFKPWIPEAQSESGMPVLFSHDYPFLGFPGGLDGKESACNTRDPGSISGSGRSPGVGNGYPLQYSRLENSMDGGAWRATVHGVGKSRTRLSDWDTHPFSSFSVGVCPEESFSCSNISGDSTSLWPGSPHPSQLPALFLTHSALDLMNGFLIFWEVMCYHHSAFSIWLPPHSFMLSKKWCNSQSILKPQTKHPSRRKPFQ